MKPFETLPEESVRKSAYMASHKVENQVSECASLEVFGPIVIQNLDCSSEMVKHKNTLGESHVGFSRIPVVHFFSVQVVPSQLQPKKLRQNDPLQSK